MLPFSSGGQPIYVWACNAPTCAYVISFSSLSVTYYKGTAAVKNREKDGKTYQEFSF
jgi:hypothetical protein